MNTTLRRTLVALLAGAAFAFAVAALTLLPPMPAAFAQSVDRAVQDLQSYHVTFEEGAVTDQDIEDLDEAAARLQASDGFFKIVVLAEPVEDFDGTQAFADEVLEALGGQGRVLVYDPEELAIASNADPAQEVARAEQAAIAEANQTDSFAEGALEAGQELGIAATGDGDEVGESGGFSVWWIVIPVGLTFLVLFLARRAFSGGGLAAPPPVSAQVLAEGERKVREAVNKAANGVIELYDRVNMPDAPAEVRQAYAEGSRIFMDTQDELEEADTQPELEAVYPKLVLAGWHMDVARAVLGGHTKPEKPEPAPLFPTPALPELAPGSPPAQPLDLPERHYRTLGENPWLTQAATAAMTLLLTGAAGGGWMRWGGLGGGWDEGRWSGRSHRPPMSDDIFDTFLGGMLGGGFGGFGGGRSGRGGRGRIRLGGGRPRIRIGGGRGMGRR